MAGSIEDNAALYKKKTFTYVPPTPPAELIESTNYTIDFVARKFLHIGIDPTENFQVTIHLLTSSRHINISPDFLRRIFSMMGHILSFILDKAQKYNRIIFLETEFHKISSMVYCGENALVIESKTQDGCRVLLNRPDLLQLQNLECCIFESIERKKVYSAPLITKQFNDFAMYLHEKCAGLKSPPKNLENMTIFFKNLQDDRTDKIHPNLIGQIQMCAAVQLAEFVQNRMESQNDEIDSPISPSFSPIPSLHDHMLPMSESCDVSDGSEYIRQFNSTPSHTKRLHSTFAEHPPISPIPSLQDHLLLSQTKSLENMFDDLQQVPPYEIPRSESCDVNDRPEYFRQSDSTPSQTKRLHSTFAEHPAPVRNVKRRLF